MTMALGPSIGAQKRGLLDSPGEKGLSMTPSVFGQKRH